MPICSYVVIPTAGAGPALCQRLKEIPGCEVVPAENRELILLVTETESREEDEALRDVLEGLAEIRALLFVFGEVFSGAPPSGVPVPDGIGHRIRPVADGAAAAPSAGADGSGEEWGGA